MASRPQADRRSSTLAGIALACSAFFFFSCLDATAKYLSDTLPVLQIVWMRFATHIVVAVLLFRIWKRPHVLRPARPFLQIVRGFLILGATIFNFLALQYLQLDETTAIMFATPLAVAILAGPMLGEWAGRHRWFAIVAGFIGILIVTRPGFGGMHWAAFYSVAAMSSYALYTLFTRLLTSTDSVEGLLIISAVIPTIALAGPALSAWVTPQNTFDWALLLTTGVFGAFGHWVLIKAYSKAPAPVLTPFMYSQIVWMVALGAILFGDIPGTWTMIGLTIVIASGLYLLYRERRIDTQAD